MQNELKKYQAENSKSPELPYLKRLEENLKQLSLEDSSRFKLLLEQLRKVGWNGQDSSLRILVFTEYIETQKALAEAVAKEFKLKHSERFEDQAKQAIASISGACPDVHLMAAVEAFGTKNLTCADDDRYRCSIRGD